VGVRTQKKADRLGSYKAGKREGLKTRKLPGLLASQPSSYELSATSYFARHLTPVTCFFLKTKIKLCFVNYLQEAALVGFLVG
jgi:hypothetical protein